jgi:hypothetical protein
MHKKAPAERESLHKAARHDWDSLAQEWRGTGPNQSALTPTG